MLEAMASGCLVIGSDTAPVREVLRHGENGWLMDFFDNAALADRLIEVLDNPAAQHPLRRQARADMVANYSLAKGLASYERLLNWAEGKNPEPNQDATECNQEATQPARPEGALIEPGRRQWA